MSEFIHPPVALGFGPDLSLERTFAEEAYLLLADCQLVDELEIDGVEILTKLTDRVDMVSEDSEKSSAFRLRSMPVLRILTANAQQMEPSADYRVILLEYGELDSSESDEEYDEEFEWRPYVMTVINEDKLGEIDILDGQTGQPLSPGDLMMAHAYLTQVRQEMRNERFGELLSEDAIGTFYDDPNQSKTYQEFDSAEFLEVSQCVECETSNQACGHNPYTLN